MIRLFALLVSLLSVGLVMAQEVMKFKAPVIRDSAPILLGDVVVSEGLSSEALAIPLPNEMQGWVTQERIGAWLQHRLSLAQAPQWKGTKKVWLDACHIVDEKQFMVPLKRALAAEVAPLELQIHKLNFKEKDRKTLCFNEVVSAINITEIKPLRGINVRTKLSLEFASGHVVDKTMFFELDAMIETLVSQSELASGTPLRMSMFSSSMRPWKGEVPLHHTQLDGLKLTKRLSTGNELSDKHVASIEMVESGQTVKVNVQHGAISIQTKGLAVSSGNHGDWIKVRVEGSRVVSQAKVVAKGVVNVSV